MPTMHFQKSLPRLPIPDLQMTCTRYLNAQKPLLSEDQFSKTESYVQHFLKNQGPELQAELKLQDSRNKHTNYICEHWFDMYLRDRRPLPINYNPIIVYNQEPEAKLNQPLVKATNLVISSMRFLKSLRAGILEPEVFHLNPQKSDTKLFRTITGLLPSAVSWYGAYMFNAYPLDMSQYKNLFNSTRVPRIEKDEIQCKPDNKHLVVLRRGHFYSFDVLDKDGKIVPAAQVASNLKQIINDNRPMNEKSVGVLTAGNRDEWAENRSHLAGLGRNSALIKLIDTAAFVLVLDDDVIGNNETKLFRTFLTGDCKNRWYDKSFSLILTKDGYAGVNFEHSWGDGVAVLRYFQDIKKDVEKRPGIRPEEVDNLSCSANVQKLDFQLDEKLEEVLRKEGEKYQQVSNELDIDCLLFEGFNRNDCKRHKLSPDAVMQLSFQLAMFKMEKRSVPVYESCSTAAFKHGRTETIRPCTILTKNLCSALTKRTVKNGPSMTEFHKMLTESCNLHSQLVKEAAMGQGFDRHLFALRKIAEKKGLDIDLYRDPAYEWINHNILSTSTLSSPAILIGGFGPVVKDGYGLGYMMHENAVGLAATSYKSQRSAAEYVKVWESSIQDLARLLKKSI